MTVNELISALMKLPPEQREKPVGFVGHACPSCRPEIQHVDYRPALSNTNFPAVVLESSRPGEE